MVVKVFPKWIVGIFDSKNNKTASNSDYRRRARIRRVKENEETLRYFKDPDKRFLLHGPSRSQISRINKGLRHWAAIREQWFPEDK